ncbi:MAG: response regulator [Haliscomenobacteraceae bacterium CHB4]|nr:response regulator [Haliscomenobacteraceae bacterium CHB4]
MRTLLIDDEDLSRQVMRHLLADHPDVRIVDEAANADEAIAKIRQHRPDLIFLDINMPGKNGFELLAELDESPHVVFVTAYDEFAVRAFETNALDYLLKPVRPERLQKTMEALRAMMRPTPPDSPADRPGKLRPDSMVFIKDGEKCYFVRLSDIFLLESEDNYVRVHFGDNRPLHRKSLNMLEEKLPPELFFRANRQQIFNLSFITGIEPFFHGSLRVTLRSGVRLEISVRRAGAFKELLSL